jgi:hypothetical protein
MAPSFLSPCSVFYFFATEILLFLFSPTSFGPSSEVHGTFKTIVGLSRAQTEILIKTSSGSRWPFRFQNRRTAVSGLMAKKLNRARISQEQVTQKRPWRDGTAVLLLYNMR